MPRTKYFLCQKPETLLPPWFRNYTKPKKIVIVGCHFEYVKEEEEVDEGDGFDYSFLYKQFVYSESEPDTPTITAERKIVLKKEVDYAFFNPGLFNKGHFTYSPLKDRAEIALTISQKLVQEFSSVIKLQGEDADEMLAFIEHSIQDKCGLKLIYKISQAETNLPLSILGWVVFFIINNMEVRPTYKREEILQVTHEVQAALSRLLSSPPKKDLMYDTMAFYLLKGNGLLMETKYTYNAIYPIPEDRPSQTLFRQYELLAQKCLIERMSNLEEFKKELQGSDAFLNNLVFQKMNEALTGNTNGLFGDAPMYKFYDAKKIMAWVFEGFFNICLGYGRPSMWDTTDGNIMLEDGSTPHGATYGPLSYTDPVFQPYLTVMHDITEQDLDVFCQRYLDLAKENEPQRVFGTAGVGSNYMDATAVRFWPNNLCFSLLNIIRNTYPNLDFTLHRYVFCNSSPLISSLANELVFCNIDELHTMVTDAQLTSTFNEVQAKFNEILTIINNDNFMVGIVRKALEVARSDEPVRIAQNKNDEVAKQIADIVVSSQTALMTTLTKGITGQGREITMHSNIVQGESYDDRYVCYVNETMTPKSYLVQYENTNEIIVWFRDGDGKIIDLENDEKKVRFRVEVILETID